MAERTRPPAGGAGVICRGAIGRIEGDDSADVDWVDVNWQQTLRRALRLTSRGGRRVDVLLPPGGRLHHGDVLSDATPTIAVCVETIDVLTVRVDDRHTLASLAFDFGNRHIAAAFGDGVVLTPDDGPARAVVDQRGLSYQRTRARFFPEPVSLDPFR